MKHLYQRLTRGFSDEDLWNLDNTMAEFILPRLKAYKELKRYGCPAELTNRKWEYRLDKMIYAFEVMNDYEFDPLPEVEYVEGPDHGKDAGDDCTIWDYRPVDEEQLANHLRAAKARKRRIRDGLKYFAEYYQSLWD